MSTDFLHGIETIEQGDGIRSIRTTKSSVIGLIGTTHVRRIAPLIAAIHTPFRADPCNF